MDDDDWLAKRFDDSRTHLRAVALRMLGSPGEADDAVQEAWLKVSRSDSGGVENLGGWLTTVVARVCLDMLRARRARGEQPLGTAADALPAVPTPESEVAFADAIGPALLVVLDTLAPQERVAFVLHDMFDLSFEEIAPIVERTPTAARQLASRARRRVRGAALPPADVAQRVDGARLGRAESVAGGFVDPPRVTVSKSRELVGAFLAASRDGDFDRLLAVLSPDAVLRADAKALRVAAAYQDRGGPVLAPEVRGAAEVARAFQGRATDALPALIDGEPGAVWAVRGQVRSAFVFTIVGGAGLAGLAGAKIAGIDLVMDDEHLGALDIEIGVGIDIG